MSRFLTSIFSIEQLGKQLRLFSFSFADSLILRVITVAGGQYE